MKYKIFIEVEEYDEDEDTYETILSLDGQEFDDKQQAKDHAVKLHEYQED